MTRFNALKDPASTIDFAIDWSLWLDEDSISNSTWSTDDGITIDSDTETDTVATVWLSGGTEGSVYSVVNQITTTLGRIAERTIEVRVVNR